MPSSNIINTSPLIINTNITLEDAYWKLNTRAKDKDEPVTFSEEYYEEKQDRAGLYIEKHFTKEQTQEQYNQYYSLNTCMTLCLKASQQPDKSYWENETFFCKCKK